MIRNVLFTIPVVAFTTLVAALAAPGPAPDAALQETDHAKAQPPARKPEGPGFTLVYSLNNSGYIDVCGCKHKDVKQGSITRRASFLKQFRATGRDLLLVDGGSSLFKIGELVKPRYYDDAVRKAELIVEAYNRMGYVALAVGPYDLSAGLDKLLEFEKRAKFALLSANLVDKKTGKPYFRPHTVVEVGDVRVGIIGLTMNTMSRVYLRKVAPDAQATDPKEAVKTSLAALRDKADLVVVLSHLPEETSREIAAEFGEIAILIDPYIQYGSHHTWIKPEEWVTSTGETVFLRGDGQGARLGSLDVTLKAPHRPLVNRLDVDELQKKLVTPAATDADRALAEKFASLNPFDFHITSLEPHLLTDPEIDALVEAWKKKIDPAAVSTLEKELPRRDEFLTAGGCRECHTKQYDWWKTTKHAKALASLEETGDEHRFDCVGCHTLGYGVAYLDTLKVGEFADVQCESCHGLSPKHADDPASHRFGRVTRDNCIICHNKEQLRKDFSFGKSRREVACPSD